jgi:hypothetical protein
VLVQRYRNVYAYLRLAGDPLRLRRLPPGWGLWTRTIKGTRPRVHGLFDRAGGLLALYARDGGMHLYFNGATWTVGPSTRIAIEARGDTSTATVLEAGAELVVATYPTPRPSRLDRYDITPHQDLFEPNLWELARHITGDTDRLAKATSDWSRGFAF